MRTHRPVRGAEWPHLNWVKSSRSGTGGGNCVEVANLTHGGRAVRDSKSPIGPALIVTSAEWAAFTTGIYNGEFD
ncbi:MAG TPA: DUF397 domain-containing protein [Pseudonocardiaceae bacterium]|nr:DUF397 domain-containing protein [Pseudonocardiaceae bacterium]